MDISISISATILVLAFKDFNANSIYNIKLCKLLVTLIQNDVLDTTVVHAAQGRGETTVL